MSINPNDAELVGIAMWLRDRDVLIEALPIEDEGMSIDENPMSIDDTVGMDTDIPSIDVVIEISLGCRLVVVPLPVMVVPAMVVPIDIPPPMCSELAP